MRRVRLTAALLGTAALMAAAPAVALASPLGAWQLPGTALSGSSADSSQIITTSDGSTVVAWLEGGHVITRTRPAGGEFGAAQTLAGTGTSPTELTLASAPDGTVWLGWYQGSSTIAAASRPAGGSFGAVQTVAAGVNDGRYLRFGFTADSSKVFLAWAESPTRVARVALKTGAGSFGSAAQPLPGIEYINDLYFNVIQSGAAEGTAVITAQNYDVALGGQRVVAAIRSPSSGTFGTIDPVSGTTDGTRWLTEPQVGPGGALTVAYQSFSTPVAIRSATLQPGATQFDPALGASSNTSNASRPALAVAPSGKIAIGYLQYIPSGSRWRATAAIKEAGAASYVQLAPPGLNVYSEDEGYSGVTIAIGPDDRATLAWATDYNLLGPGTFRTELASSQGANGSLATPVEVSARGTYATHPSLYFTPDGDLTAMWADSLLSSINVASRSAGAGPTDPFSAPLTLTSNGQPTGFTTARSGMQSIIWSDSTGTVSFASTTSPQRNLTITKAGAGGGTVTSSPTGIDCGSACTATYNQGRSVTLTATPSAGSSFTGWSSSSITAAATSCANSSPTCTVSVDSDTNVVATFDPTPPGPTPPGPTPPGPAPSNRFGIVPGPANGTSLSSTLIVPGPGTATQYGSFSGLPAARGARRLTACTGSKVITKAGRYRIACRLTAAARSARRRGPVRVSLRTTFTPAGGTARTILRTVTLPSNKPNFTG